MSAAIAAQSDAAPTNVRATKIAFTAEREGDVLPDDPQRPPGVPNQPGQPREVVGHQRDVGRLDGGVGAGPAHRDAEARARQRRCVVDPVADHRDRS